MNSELSKYIEEGLKKGSVQPGLQQNNNNNQQSFPEINPALVWKILFAFIIALVALLWIFTSKSALRSDQIYEEFQISENFAKNFNSTENILNQTKFNSSSENLEDWQNENSSQTVLNENSSQFFQNDEQNGDQRIYWKDGLICVQVQGNSRPFCHPDDQKRNGSDKKNGEQGQLNGSLGNSSSIQLQQRDQLKSNLTNTT